MSFADIILTGRYELWRGLPEQLTVSALIGELGGVAHAPVERIRASHRYRVATIERESAPRVIEAWTLEGADGVSILEWHSPLCSDLETALRDLGEPDLILDKRHESATHFVEEYVYPRRGLTLSVGRPVLEGTSRILIHAQLYAPVSRAEYLTEIDDGDSVSPKTH